MATVLTINPDQIERRFLALALSRGNHLVLSAATINEAERMIEQIRVDVILTNNPLLIAQSLALRNLNVPVLAIANMAAGQDMVFGAPLVTRPILVQNLLAKVEAVLNESHP